jgi:hypothetical protein
MAPRHQRFALREVTFAGVALPGATVDCWHDADGHAQWSARLVTRLNVGSDSGELAGRTADGRLISGRALVADRQVGPKGKHEVLVVFHGSGVLHGFGDQRP